MDTESRKTGTLFVISAPSGAGKTTICTAVREIVPDIVFSISHTTRKPRPGERQGVDYYFVTKAGFEKKIKAGKWAEWARVYDNYYGTSAEFIDSALSHQQNILLDIDVQGAAQIRKTYPGCVTVFIMPPSIAALRARLESRQTDDPETILKRLANAEKEIAQKGFYRHIIVNDDLQEAISEMAALISRYSH